MGPGFPPEGSLSEERRVARRLRPNYLLPGVLGPMKPVSGRVLWVAESQKESIRMGGWSAMYTRSLPAIRRMDHARNCRCRKGSPLCIGILNTLFL